MRLRAGFVPQAAAANPQSAEHPISELRWFPVREPVSGKRYTVLRVRTRSGLTGVGRVRGCSGRGDQSSRKGLDRQVGHPVRRNRPIFPSRRRARHGDARHSRKGGPCASLSSPGRTDPAQGARLCGVGGRRIRRSRDYLSVAIIRLKRKINSLQPHVEATAPARS
jgi:hypothetical protein